ncbi:MAG TPA: glycosyltransferase, partial [Fermentimonas sp.]|nr:glycosyltransferase [Fermentimonas sp.]
QEQTYPFVEHVIVDGNSTDNTVRVIQKYDNEKLVWISEPDEGLYHAMNKGISISSGNYLCFLNAGDTFHSIDSVESIMSAIKDSDNIPDIIYGETAIVDNNGKFLHMRRLKAPDKLNWKSFKQGMVVCHQAFIANRKNVIEYNTGYRFSSDFDWCIEVMKRSSSIYNTKTTLINYLNEGLTTMNRKASLKERYKIMVKHYGHVSTFLHHIWFLIRAVIK